jgi:hypothetical protein
MTIQEILGQLRVEFVEPGDHHHSRPGWVNLDCPFCGTSGGYHMGFRVSLGYFNCWRCGGHHVVSVLSKLGASRAEIEAFLQDRRVSPEEYHEKKRTSLKEPGGRGPLRTAHREYLRRRGFDAEEVTRLWQIEGISLSTRLAWRLYIPVVYRDRRVSWTTRAIGEKVKQRYISAGADEEEINHKELCYGLDYCFTSVIIVEGPTDVWRIGPGAVGLFGTSYLPGQVRKLIDIPRRIVCFDPEPRAQQQAEKLCDELSGFPGETMNVVLDSEDPGSATPREIRRLRRLARLLD